MANILQATFQNTFLFELRIYMILHDYFPLIQWNKSPLVGVMVRQAIVWTNDGQTHIYASCQWVNWWGTVYHKKFARGFCFAVLCCGYTLTDFPISIRLTSLALWQSNDCPSASKATLMNMNKYFMWINYERLHNHNKAKHSRTVCIFLGIYCMYETSLESQTKWSALVGLCELHFVDNLFNQPTNQPNGDLCQRGVWSPFLTSDSSGAWFKCPRCSLPWVPGRHFCVNKLRPRQDGCHFQTTISNAFSWII